MSNDLEDIKSRMAADKARIAALPWAKVGYMLSEKSVGVPTHLMLDYWDKKYREGITLGAEFWDNDDGGPSAVIRMACELADEDLKKLDAFRKPVPASTHR